MKRQITLFVAALLLTVLIWTVPSPLVRYSLDFVLLWLLPGRAWAWAWA